MKLRDVGEAATDHVTREGRLPVNLPVACGPGVVCAWGGGAPLPRRMARRWRWVSWLDETKRETQKAQNSQLFPSDENMFKKLRGLKRFLWVLGSRPARKDTQGLPGLCAGSHGTTGAPWVALPSAGNRAGLPGLCGCSQESLWASWVALPSAGTHRACQATVRGFSRVPTRRCPNNKTVSTSASK